MADVLHAALFQPELLPGETLLWTGRPDTAKHFARADRYQIPFSLVVCGYFVYRFGRSITEGGYSGSLDVLSLLAVAALLAVVTFYLLFGRFWLKRRTKLQTYYAITNLRALALISGTPSRLQSRFLDPSAGLKKQAGNNGSGSLIIGELEPIDKFTANTGIDEVFGNSESSILGLFDIADVEEAHETIKSQL